MATRKRTRNTEPEPTEPLPGRAPVIGQDGAIATLSKSLASSRFASSWIFHGPEGVGKRTTALRLSRLLLEETLTTAQVNALEPPADSPAQALIDAATHPDLLLLRKEMAADSQIPRLREKKQVDIPVDLLREHIIGGMVKQESREFTPTVYLSPNRAPRRVFIIDEAELLNPTGQNALLKTLEEPPASSVLVLLTTNPARLLPTIRSRCQSIGFRRLEDSAMDAWLAREAPEIDPGDLPWLKAFADGSPGRLLFAIEHDLLEWRDQMAEDLEQLCAGRYVPNLWQEFVALIDDFAKGREKANRRTSIESAKREGLDVILGMIAMELRHRMHSASGEGDHAGAERYARAIDPIVDAERRVGRSLNLKMVLADMTAALSERMQPAGGGA